MKTYPSEHWQALGSWVAGARTQAGHSDTKLWAAAVKRSTRQLLGLERGEPVGPKTIEAVAAALEIESGVLFSILDSGKAARTWDEVKEAALEAADRRALAQPDESQFWTNPEGDEADEPVTWSHMEGRLAEIEMRIRRIERAVLRVADKQTEGGDGDADDTGSSAPTNELDDRRTELSEGPERVLRVANKGDVEPEEGALTDP